MKILKRDIFTFHTNHQTLDLHCLSGFIALLVLTAMGCGMQNMCRRRNETDDDDSSVGYSVAVSNSLLKEESFVSKAQPPCMNCVLIEMGEMVCYSERCPDCGRWEAGQAGGDCNSNPAEFRPVERRNTRRG